MYSISEQQIEFILNDIRRNGVELEDLQYNLLDHVCCIIEQELEENGDFEQFYQSAIKRFYKNRLEEIEDETITLLINKHYYTMKKIMLISGTAAAAMLSFGIISKFMHWPGAGMEIVLGITTLSLIFLPLLFTLKIKERQQTKDKVLLALGSISAITISMGIMFKIMHWPGANMLGVTSLLVLLLLFLPVYFITGIRNPETKVNTIVSTIIIIMGSGLFMSLARSPHASHNYAVSITANYLRNEKLLDNQWKLTNDSIQKTFSVEAQKTISICNDLKNYFLQMETGLTELKEDDLNTDKLLGETYASVYVDDNVAIKNKIEDMKANLTKIKGGEQYLKLIEAQSVKEMRVADALNILVQIEMFVLQQAQF